VEVGGIPVPDNKLTSSGYSRKSVRKKDLLARFLRVCGGLRAVTLVHRRSRSRLLVLAYHRVLPAMPDEQYPFDAELVSASPEEFDWQMAWVRRYFTPMAVSDIADCLDHGSALPAGAVAVTFDDGFADNYSYAWPVLRDHGIPACIFLSTSYVGTDTPYWFEAVAQVLLKAPVGSVRIPVSDTCLPSADDHDTRRQDIRSILSKLKQLPDELRQVNMDSLRAGHADLLDARQAYGAHAMSWSNVGEMARSGIEFGSHGMSHAVLSRLSDADLMRELTGSRRAIEQATGIPVSAIAYPVGGEHAIGERVVAAAREAGYRIGFTYLPGCNAAAPANRMQLARQHVERDTGRAYFQGLLALPSTFD
jgi:peptidoglycan/xylan/chitin deacetylase (PgdA/CDA1 family)